jgi:hypothetical protein
MGEDINGFSRWIVEKLTAVQALGVPNYIRGIWDTVIPLDANTNVAGQNILPAIVFTLQSSNDVRGMGAYRIFKREIYVIKVVFEARGFKACKAYANAMDDALQGASGETADHNFYVAGCVRLGTIRYAEISEGTQYYHLGGTYRFHGYVK